MRVSLISPPFLDPRAPYLAVPSLTAYLRMKGYRVTQTDLNVLTLSSLLTSTYLRSLFESAEHPAVRYCIEHVDQAVRDLRHPVSFFDFATYSRSRNVLDLALRCISSRYPGADLNLRRITAAAGTLAQVTALVLHGKETPFDRLYADEFVPRILAEDPELVGISVSNGSQLLPALRLSRRLKRRGARVILGGPVITRFREEIARAEEFFALADGAIIYEGEEALERLMANLGAGKEPFSGIRNCIYKDRTGIVIRNEPFALNLSTLPTPDFDGLPLGSYFAPFPVLPLLSAKGCSWGLCTFCTIPDTSSSAGIRSRERPTEKVVDDLVALKEKYGARHFVFVDEDVSANRLERLGRSIRERRLDVLWLAYSRFEKGHTPERCRVYYEAGCRKLLMGLESASPRILRLMRKGITPQTVRANLIALHEAKVSAHLFCMLGFPSETRKEMEATMSFIREHRRLLFKKGFSASFSDFVLDRDSDVDQQPEKFGVAKGERMNDWKFVGPANGEETPAVSELQELRRRFNAELRDLFYPNEMIGWEEYTLLYEDSAGECRFPWRKSSGELAALVRGANPGSLVLQKRPFRVVGDLVSHTRGRWWLINLDSAYTLAVGMHARDLLDEVDGDADLETVTGRFAAKMGRDASAVGGECLRLIESLLKHGYLEAARAPEPSRSATEVASCRPFAAAVGPV